MFLFPDLVIYIVELCLIFACYAAALIILKFEYRLIVAGTSKYYVIYDNRFFKNSPYILLLYRLSLFFIFFIPIIVVHVAAYIQQSRTFMEFLSLYSNVNFMGFGKHLFFKFTYLC